MHTDRKKYIQTSRNIGRERNGERERGGEDGKEGRKRHRETQEGRDR